MTLSEQDFQQIEAYFKDNMDEWLQSALSRQAVDFLVKKGMEDHERIISLESRLEGQKEVLGKRIEWLEKRVEKLENKLIEKSLF